MTHEVVTVIGGSGFVGSYIVKALAQEGYTVNIASRTPENARYLKTSSSVGKVSLTSCNIRNDDSIKQAIAHSDIVINLVGILYQRKKQTFAAVHAQAAERIAQIAKETGVKRYIHMSALGVDKATTSNYARTKLAGEKAVLAAFPEATILRPSIIFGPGDNFFNFFAKITSFSPILPLIGGGHTKFQPVYVGDIAKAVVAILETPSTEGAIFELGGPKTYSFKELLRFLLKHIDKRRYLLSIPFPIAMIEAAFLELFPAPLLTRDQVRLLKTDNVVTQKKDTFSTLGITPRSIKDIVPDYLARFRKA